MLNIHKELLENFKEDAFSGSGFSFTFRALYWFSLCVCVHVEELQRCKAHIQTKCVYHFLQNALYNDDTPPFSFSFFFKLKHVRIMTSWMNTYRSELTPISFGLLHALNWVHEIVPHWDMVVWSFFRSWQRRTSSVSNNVLQWRVLVD